ncbi:MAG: DNA translocase FtsK 4TM domain-containing protein [Candidatus Kerfeldbacteria bacterium]
MAKRKTLKQEPAKKRGRPPKDEEAEPKQQRKKYTWDEDDGGAQRGLLVIFLFAVSAVSLLSFVNAAGDFGVWVDEILGWVFGWGRYIVPFIIAALAYLFLNGDKYEIRMWNWIGLAFFLLSGLALLHLFIPYVDFTEAAKAGKGGGYLGIVFSIPLIKYAGIWVAIIVLLGLFIASVSVMLSLSIPALITRVREFGFFGGVWNWLKTRLHARMNGYKIGAAKEDAEEDEDDESEEGSVDGEPEEEPAFSTKEVEHTGQEQATDKDLEQMSFIPKRSKRRGWSEIPLSLLSERNEKPTSGDIEENKEKIRLTLESFGIPVEMGEVNVGPMVSQYTLAPQEGVKLTQITTLHNDISLALAAFPIRIEAPIPGKALVGIEVPNKAIATVTLRQILTSKVFKKRKDNLTLCLGKDVAGKPFVTSLSGMPHLLIAGATGSGKSVCINSVICGLMYQNSPDDLKFILVDPKRVELSNYNDIPYLLTPVITDIEKTVNSLKWTVAEMDRRYEMLQRAGARSIDEYNSKVDEDERMTYIVFVIDELADLMSVAANSVEAAIVRLAQMARAVGIHLVLATQRPSVNVITGLIKANMPARIAFSVASQVDSRTILDFSGAEKLLGRGDMLFIDATLSRPKRLQGAHLESKDIDAVVDYLRNREKPEYDSDVTESNTGKRGISGVSGGAEDSDELLDDAKEVILQAGKASASLLQRRLRVGYARAARILDILEEEGFIGPADGAKPREILVQDEAAGESMIGEPGEEPEEPDEPEDEYSDEESQEDLDPEDRNNVEF